MLTSVFFTVAGTVLTGGGVWIVALFVPTVSALLKSTLDFARSPLGMTVAAIVTGFVLFSSAWVSGDLHGTRQTRAQWRAANVAAATARAKNEAAITSGLTTFAERNLAAADLFTNTLDAKVKEHDAHTAFIAARRATADDIRRLFSIR